MFRSNSGDLYADLEKDGQVCLWKDDDENDQIVTTLADLETVVKQLRAEYMRVRCETIAKAVFRQKQEG